MLTSKKPSAIPLWGELDACLHACVHACLHVLLYVYKYRGIYVFVCL